MNSTGRDQVGSILSAINSEMPDYEVKSVVRLGEGMENFALEVNGELVVRFSKEPDPARRAALVRHEARLLETVAGISTLPVPRPVFTVPHQGCLAYFKVPGKPLLNLPHEQRSVHGVRIAAVLGELLGALHSVPVGRMADLVDTDAQPPVGWLEDAAKLFGKLAGEIPGQHRKAVEAFLKEPALPEPTTLVFSHNDLGIEHVLVDPTSFEVTGIIDWGDAAICDPAYDFGLIYRDLGPEALDAALASYRRDGDGGALREQATFYGRCSVLEDLEYGAEKDERFRDKSLHALQWLFP